MKLNALFNSVLDSNGKFFFQKLVPGNIVSNLRESFELRPYQLEALGRFVYYWEGFACKPQGIPIQLLFHMATGSGKTLMMAGLILYLFQQGYRNFLFFVNSTNIIEKTKDNFLNGASSKYLFSSSISFFDKRVSVNLVDNFQNSDPDNINICFSTVQGLHNALNFPKENSITYDDFENDKLVLIADEAHHINADTKAAKKLSSDEIESIRSWEGTVARIFSANSQNVMLEFTATADLENQSIAEKYDEKLIFDYPLRQFRADGYSKDVQTLQADLPSYERSIQAILLSQYRRKLFEKHGVLIKPVILFKSKTIKDSKDFQVLFTEQLKSLTSETLRKIKDANPDTIIKKVFDYCEENNIDLDNLCEELKNDFNEDKQISVNSVDESEEKQIAINSLESEDNEYRAVFAVDKLNEGWDVLNLFDIVRLYDTRDASKGVPGKTTMQEAQLIGRGARYCPFSLDDSENKYMRKYDSDLENEMRICEELYYHASYNPRYIQELNSALIEIGIKAPKNSKQPLNLKQSFKDTKFYQTGLVFLNERVKYGNEDIFSLKSSLIDQVFSVKLQTGIVKQKQAFIKDTHIDKNDNVKEKEYQLKDLGAIVLREALNRLDFYRFNNLKKYLPHLKSYTEFIESNDYLGKIKVSVQGNKSDVDNLSPEFKLQIAMEVLYKVASVISSDKIDYKGSYEFKPHSIKQLFNDKVLNYTLDGSDKEFGKPMSDNNCFYHLDLSQMDWYAFNECYGTSEEKALILYINSKIDDLKKLYDEIYLVRNEKHFQIYAFYDGRAFEPDFVLFLKNKKEEAECQFQIFIEPKGKHLLLQDEWKEDFLKSIKDNAEIKTIWQGKDYDIWGLPFYCKGDVAKLNEFKEKFDEVIL